jgi:uncharacterized membrane protein SpoIIM required for sporulation
MRETNFIEQNKDKWREFEQVMDSPRKDPEKLNGLFVQITDDLSYSRTFYPNRSVRVYLNGLAQRIFFSIYQNRRSPAGRLLTFWSAELPQLIYEARREFRFTFLVFLLSCLIGAVSSAMDEQFARVIMGDSYIDMTLANIESGDPMAVYKQKGAFSMSLGITFNNIFVAFLAFVMGAFFTLGSLAILIRNGIMLGTFQYFFVQQDLFWESFLTIWIHGTLEISAIIIAGTAGVTMGKGLVFPGTYTRGQAFQRSARRGIKILAGTVPIFIIAGFIEGYLTRHTDAPNALRAAFILACLAFVLVYFVWYPRHKARLGFAKPIQETRIPFNQEQLIDFRRIKASGELFSDMLVFYKKHLRKITLAALGAASLYCSAAFLVGAGSPAELFAFPSEFFGTISVINQFFVNEKIPLLPLISVLCAALLATRVFYALAREEQGGGPGTWHRYGADFLKTCLAMAGLQLLLWTNDWYTGFLLIAAMPLPVLWGYVAMREGRGPIQALGRSLPLLTQAYGKTLGLSAVLFIVAYLFFGLADTGLAWFFLELITWVVQLSPAAMQEFSAIVLTFIAIFILHLVYAMLFVSVGLLYYSLREEREAPALMERIAQIGLKKSIRGLEQE